MSMIRVSSLVKRFESLEVLRGISLRIEPGEVVAIIGPSGGGKSTFLRCLNGLETFEAGEVEVAGILLTPDLLPVERQARLLQIRRKAGMVFQQFHLFPHRSVLGNVVEAPIQVLGMPRAAAESLAESLLARVGLRDKISAMPDTLSGGQQQRVAIARALAMQPEVLLFDEPTSALDPKMAAEVENVIADLASAGQTMVVVTHSMGLASRCAKTVHLFEHGHIARSGPPEELCLAASK